MKIDFKQNFGHADKTNTEIMCYRDGIDITIDLVKCNRIMYNQYNLVTSSDF
jgi:hypothetical protein